MYLTFEGGREDSLQIEFKKLECLPGRGAHRLALRYELTPKGRILGSVLLLHGRLSLADGAASWIGNLHADEALPLASANWPRDILLSTTISDAQLAQLTDRISDALSLRVDLNAAVVGGDHQLSWPAATSQEDLRIERSDWLKVAEQLGALVAVTITVPLPLGDPEANQARIGRHLQTGLRALAEGRPADAVRDARLAVEILRDVGPENSYQSVPARQRDLDQRFAALRQAAFDLASGAAHADGITKDFVYSRSDAAAILGCIAAVAAHDR